MLDVILESTSIFYIITVLVTIICLVLTSVFCGVGITRSVAVPETKMAPNQVKESREDLDNFMEQKKPLRLAKKLEAKLVKEDKILEQRVEEKQMENILKLMQQQGDQFGNTSLEDLKNQMKLYGL